MTDGVDTRIRVPVLLGPTAVGKTDLAVEFCAEQGWEILSCDSRQVYRGMDIGTAKPTGEQRSHVKHHLVDIVNPDNVYSAFQFATDAGAVLGAVASTGGTVMVCGGTGFYFKSLSEGLDTVADPDPELRMRLRAKAASEGAESIFKELELVDPARAARIHPHDVQRTLRALEVYYASGIFSSEQSNSGFPNRKYFFDVVVVVLPREELYRRIDKRVELMAENGLWDEFLQLRRAGYDEQSPGLLSPGYRELFAVERGDLTFAEACEKIKTNTRRFAKRQLTWFRTQSSGTVIDLSVYDGERVRKHFLQGMD